MDGYGKRVLILDDNEDIRHVTGIALTNCRYNVYSAADGAEGLEAMTKRRYDVVLVDYNMPRINGSQFIEISQVSWPKTPISSCPAMLASLMKRCVCATRIEHMHALPNLSQSRSCSSWSVMPVGG